ncbi:3-deoxy-D-manno-octulosonic acid transferase [Pseudophaeobacter arcticus]|uniref:3-deoxy-D-manno-octulosonic acid transferase n=1 Tax=Pseudophaeobacter arcticus TaxID=385492 RepID=UPI00042403B9|nr:3-deoxy-D-manno-octulosonic acid transferase [Pseudophaeobacter arcticus]
MTKPDQTASPTLLFYSYRALTRLLAPFAYRKVSAKLAAHGVSDRRQRERLGHASQPRPDLAASASLIWFHGASVGESLAAITLINRLHSRLPGNRFLLTSGTATSAAMAVKRLPDCAQHQFAPLDSSAAVARFLAHWRPDAGIFVESELWPVTLAAAKARGTRLALVNARLSAKSVTGWRKKLPTARFIMGLFDLLLTQNKQVAEDLLSLGADPARVFPSGNLKAGAAALPHSADLLAEMRAALAGRALWIASSTHKGEEETVLDAHKALLQDHPDLCLLLVPRHPERADEIGSKITQAGLTYAQRSTGAALTPDTQVYLADTLGELGTWYALSPIVFLGGSLLPIGGHNPFEVAQAGAAVLTGPGYSNFIETYPPLIAAGGAKEVCDATELAQAVDLWLTQPDQLQNARDAARHYVDEQSGQLDVVVDRLISSLGLHMPERAP